MLEKDGDKSDLCRWRFHTEAAKIWKIYPAYGT